MGHFWHQENLLTAASLGVCQSTDSPQSTNPAQRGFVVGAWAHPGVTSAGIRNGAWKAICWEVARAWPREDALSSLPLLSSLLGWFQATASHWLLLYRSINTPSLPAPAQWCSFLHLFRLPNVYWPCCPSLCTAASHPVLTLGTNPRSVMYRDLWPCCHCHPSASQLADGKRQRRKNNEIGNKSIACRNCIASAPNIKYNSLQHSPGDRLQILATQTWTFPG